MKNHKLIDSPVLQVLVTTSRDPSSKLTSFAKEVALVIPGAKSQNRGATVIAHLVESCRSSDISDMIIVHETRQDLPLSQPSSAGQAAVHMFALVHTC